MKELSIEEKAKRYDEALEKFDVILNLNTVKESGTIFVDDVRKIFPELKESEDERIRKELISFFTERAKYIEDSTFNRLSSKEIIAWLEKQDEQKSAEWSKEDEMIALSIEQVMNCASLLNIVPEKIDKIRTWLKSLKDRYTWKPSGEQMDALETAVSSLQNTALESLYNELKKL